MPFVFGQQHYHHQPPFFFFFGCGFLFVFAAPPPAGLAAGAPGVGVEAFPLPGGVGEAAAGEAALGIAP